MYRVKANPNDPRGATYAEYRREKYVKMRNQLAETYLTDLFKGKVFWLNGRLEPPVTYLRKLIGVNGGQAVFYWNNTVNIMVVQQLSSVSYMKYSTKLDIVTPDYVLYSVEQQKTLDPKEFMLNADQWQARYAEIVADEIFAPFEVAKGGEFPEPPEIQENTELFLAFDYVVYIPQWDEIVNCKPTSNSGLQTSPASGSPISAVGLSPQASKQPQQYGFYLHYYHAFSRLHHLSKWKLDAQEYLIENPPYGPQPQVNYRPFYCHIDIDCFFVYALTAGDPSRYATIPIAVCSCQGGQMSTADVCSCNYVARASGVRNGMFLREAKSLCPDLQVMQYDFELYQQFSRYFYECLRDVTSDINPVSCDEAYLRLTGIVDENNCYDFMQKLKRRIFEQLGITVTIGVGYSVLTARLATKMSKPDGAFYLRNEEIMQHLEAREVSIIPQIGPQLSSTLAAHEIVTCRDCFAQSLSTLQYLIGDARGRQLFNALRGNDIIFSFRPISRDQLPKAISVSANYGVRARTVYDLRSVFDYVFDELLSRLLARKLAYSAFYCKVALIDKKSDQAYAKVNGMGHCVFANYDIQLRSNETDPQALDRLFAKISSRTNLREFRGLQAFAKISGKGSREVKEKAAQISAKTSTRVTFEPQTRLALKMREVVDMSDAEFLDLISELTNCSPEIRRALLPVFGLQYCRRGHFEAGLALAEHFGDERTMALVKRKWRYLLLN